MLNIPKKVNLSVRFRVELGTIWLITGVKIKDFEGEDYIINNFMSRNFSGAIIIMLNI